MYTTSRHAASVSVPDYLDGFVAVEQFLEACKSCPNYNNIWSCPPYNFDVMDYWKKFSNLKLLAVRIVFDPEMLERTYTSEELNHILSQVLPVEKQKLSDELMLMEKDFPGSVSLSAGSCQLCRNCSRPSGNPCSHPDTMRYSIESLGGNVGLTIRKLMGLNLEWMEEGKLPHHFVLVSGLLMP